MPGADSGWKPPALAAVHPRHVPPCAPGMAATRLCRGARRRAPLPCHPATRRRRKELIPRRLSLLETETNARRRWGFLSERQSDAPAWPPPTRCLHPCPQGSRQAGGGQAGGRVAAARPPTQPLAPPTSGLGFPGGLQPGRGVVCGFPEVWGLLDFRDLFFKKKYLPLGTKSRHEGAPPRTCWALPLHAQHYNKAGLLPGCCAAFSNC